MKVVDLIVVYGTLRQGLHAHYKMLGSQFLGEEELPGRIFSLGGFPGVNLSVVDGSSERFTGEVYRINHETYLDTLRSLDAYEGCRGEDHPDNLYNRKVIETSFGPAFIYEFNGPPREAIPQGDWKEYVTNGR